MSAHHLPLKATFEEHVLAVETAVAAGDGDGAIFRLLDAYATLGRYTAQHSWLKHYDAEERDERIEADEDELVFHCLKSSWSKVYPELPRQIESVLREAFEDEFFRCEDPLGWADMNDETPGDTGVLQ